MSENKVSKSFGQKVTRCKRRQTASEKTNHCVIQLFSELKMHTKKGLEMKKHLKALCRQFARHKQKEKRQKKHKSRKPNVGKL